MAGAYAGTSTIIFNTVMGNKKVALLKVDITNYYSTGIPTVKASAGIGVAEAVIVFFTGLSDEAENPSVGTYIPSTDIVYLYNKAGGSIANDTDLNSDAILIYLLVIGV
jgi:hypothetical protein